MQKNGFFKKTIEKYNKDKTNQPIDYNCKYLNLQPTKNKAEFVSEAFRWENMLTNNENDFKM